MKYSKLKKKLLKKYSKLPWLRIPKIQIKKTVRRLRERARGSCGLCCWCKRGQVQVGEVEVGG